MKTQAFNPYLPLYEYVPDGEPYVFDDRVYIYGSHDLAGGDKYCPGDYVTWSAPVDDLGNWRYEGVIYKRTQDPSNREGRRELWAPDVAKAPNGKFYLYYCFAFLPEIGVAVSDSPTGPFEFYGHVKYPANLLGGKDLNEHLPFDPGVLVDDDGRVYLYYGFSPAGEMKAPDAGSAQELGLDPAELEKMKSMKFSLGGMVVELESDMLTMKGEPRVCLPGAKIAQGTGFEGHAFFEASSLRKVRGNYYYIYSSQLSHELCYAVSRYPDRDFAFGGTIISNGDIGYHANQTPTNMMGNNHGSIVQIGNEWYIFYHRQTHGTEASRQGCAERIQILPDGSIPQIEMTSCGLNDGPLIAKAIYPAAIACHLTGISDMSKINFGDSVQKMLPYIFEEKCGADEKDNLSYIANIMDGVTIGYKYFDFVDVTSISLKLQGSASGKITVRLDAPTGELVGEKATSLQENDWQSIDIPVNVNNGVHALYFEFAGTGAFQFRELGLA